MSRGTERINRVREALQDASLDALVCTLPTNVLLLSGYWPVVGDAVAVASQDGRVIVLAPEDERDLAKQGWATELRTYHPGSVTRLVSPVEAVCYPLATLLRDLGVAHGRIGYESGDAYEQASYAASYLYGGASLTVLNRAVPQATLMTASAPLTRLRSAMTPEEVGRVRLACEVARAAFAAGTQGLRPGLQEPQVAAAFAATLSSMGLTQAGVARAGGFVYCMSGPNSALAGGAYARTRARALCEGDLVLVHCNSYVDGYWTDVTRTYCLGEPDERRRAMYAAIFEARAAALSSIRPGAEAADVDRAARDALTARGFGKEFTHGVGHNVGFSAISAEYPPRLHPASGDRLEIGMTFNVEPAIYVKGYGGLRHCDVVTLGEMGAEVLTPFQASLDELIVHSTAPGRRPTGCKVEVEKEMHRSDS